MFLTKHRIKYFWLLITTIASQFGYSEEPLLFLDGGINWAPFHSPYSAFEQDDLDLLISNGYQNYALSVFADLGVDLFQSPDTKTNYSSKFLSISYNAVFNTFFKSDSSTTVYDGIIGLSLITTNFHHYDVTGIGLSNRQRTELRGTSLIQSDPSFGLGLFRRDTIMIKEREGLNIGLDLTSFISYVDGSTYYAGGIGLCFSFY